MQMPFDWSKYGFDIFNTFDHGVILSKQHIDLITAHTFAELINELMTATKKL